MVKGFKKLEQDEMKALNKIEQGVKELKTIEKKEKKLAKKYGKKKWYIMTRVVHILARNLDAAMGIAMSNKNLDVWSGNWVQSIPEKAGGLRTYSFKIKKA